VNGILVHSHAKRSPISTNRVVALDATPTARVNLSTVCVGCSKTPFS
jgi:hypothetical protein